jgi:ribosomal protein S16
MEIDEDRALYWLSQVAQATAQVIALLKAIGAWERFPGAKRAEKRPPRAAKAPTEVTLETPP